MTVFARTVRTLLGLGLLAAVVLVAAFLWFFGPLLGAAFFAPTLPGILFGKGGSMEPATFENVGLPIVEQFGGEPTLRAVVRGGVAFTATGPRLLALDLSDPSAPKRLGALLLGGDVRDLLLRGAHLYVANGTHGLRVIDTSNPAALREVAGLHTGGAADRVFEFDGRLIVWSKAADLMEVSTDDPAAPRIVSTMTRREGGGLHEPRTGVDRVVAGATGLFVSNAFFGGEHDEAIRLPAWREARHEQIVPPARILRESPDFRHAEGALWDWRDPDRPVKLGDAPGLSDPVGQLELAGGRAYVSGSWRSPDERDGIAIYDASRAGTLRPIGFVPARAQTFSVDGDRLHVTTLGCAIETWDVSRPAAPRRLGGWCAPADAELVSLDARDGSIWAGGQAGLFRLRLDASGALESTRRFGDHDVEDAAIGADGSVWTVAHYALRRLRPPAAEGEAWRIEDWPVPASHGREDRQFDGDLLAMRIAHHQTGTPTELLRDTPPGWRRLDVVALPGSAMAAGRSGTAEGAAGLRGMLPFRQGAGWSPSTLHALGPPRLARFDDVDFTWALHGGLLWDARTEGERAFLRARDALRPQDAPRLEIELPATQRPRAYAFGERHLYVRAEIDEKERGRRLDQEKDRRDRDRLPVEFLLVYAIERDARGVPAALRLARNEPLPYLEQGFARHRMTVHGGLLGYQAGMSTYVLRDLADPADPVRIARLELDRWNDAIQTFQRAGDRIVAGTEKSGLFVFDLRAAGRERSR